MVVNKPFMTFCLSLMLIWTVETTDTETATDNNESITTPVLQNTPYFQQPYTGLVYTAGPSQYIYPYQSNPYVTSYGPGYTYVNLNDIDSLSENDLESKESKKKNKKKKKPNAIGNALAAGAGLALVGLAAHHLSKPRPPQHHQYPGYNNYYYQPSTTTGYHPNVYRPPTIPSRPTYINSYPSYPTSNSISNYPVSNTFYPSNSYNNYRPSYTSSKPFYGGIAKENNKDTNDKNVGTTSNLFTQQQLFYYPNNPYSPYVTYDPNLIKSKPTEETSSENDKDANEDTNLVGASYVGFFTPDNTKPDGIFGHPNFGGSQSNLPIFIKPSVF